MWSNRDRNLYWNPGVFTEENKDPNAPKEKLTLVASVSLFRLLFEKGLIYRVPQGFCMHEAKAREWNDFIASLKVQSSTTDVSDDGDNKQAANNDIHDKGKGNVTTDAKPSRSKRRKQSKTPHIFGLIAEVVGICFFWACMLECHNIKPLLFYFVGLFLSYSLAGYSLSRLNVRFKYLLLGWIAATVTTGLVVCGNVGGDESKSPRFAIIAKTTMLVKRKTFAPGFWLACDWDGERVIFPIHVAALIQLTSQEQIATMIDSFSIETEVAKDRWERLPAINVDYGQIYIANPAAIDNGLHMANKVTFIQPHLTSALKNKEIEPGATVYGWVFLEAPKDGEVAKMRMRMRETNGKESVELVQHMEEPVEKPIQDLAGFSMTTPPEDISHLRRTFLYSDMVGDYLHGKSKPK